MQVISIERSQNNNEEIIIQEGLLQGQSFYSDDLKDIKSGESIDCFGDTSGFSLGFSLGFNS
ncbi:hypothetical protein [Chryseobacterium viscerum]|uniref:Uncharacterized protein n=1 Tax=Chryseobacterium viscerum TaxID=1037377 RepID=A0A5N4BJ60_9FLAO|nr:hypothetical protein [Chryseobacterium viscerum]KAB1228443.1 hypothetical protein F8D52_22470 [Chryseobacterium viscerum]